MTTRQVRSMNSHSPRKQIRIPNYDYSQIGSYFITICTLERRKILSKITVGTPLPGCPSVQLLWHGEIAEQFIQQMNAFYSHISVDNYVIMPDHIHLILTIHAVNGHPGRGVPTKTSEISRFIGTFKRFCNREYGENIWQSRFYDHVIRNSQDYLEIWEYIENNPAKYAAKAAL